MRLAEAGTNDLMSEVAGLAKLKIVLFYEVGPRTLDNFDFLLSLVGNNPYCVANVSIVCVCVYALSCVVCVCWCVDML